MPKALCLISLVVSILVIVLFLADAIIGFAGRNDLAPLGAASMLMDIAFIIFGGAMLWMSYSTYREQR